MLFVFLCGEDFLFSPVDLNLLGEKGLAIVLDRHSINSFL